MLLSNRSIVSTCSSLSKTWMAQIDCLGLHLRDSRSLLSSTTSKGPPPSSQVRLSKWISQHSTISRKQAERLILSHQVTVAGKTVESPAIMFRLSDLKSSVKVEGKLLNPENTGPMKTRVWAVHKLAGEMVSENDPSNRPSIIQRLYRDGLFKKQNIHLKPIGRLDMNTEGLLLLTNDGDFSRQMELPINQIHRVYRVRVHGLWSQYKLDALRRGMTIKRVRYAPMKVDFDDTRKNRSTNQWMKIACSEGKNRQIRKVLEVLGLKVTRLIRISYGDYQLQTIPRGRGIEVPVKPVETQKCKGPLFPKTVKKASDKKDEEENDEASPVQWVRAVKS